METREYKVYTFDELSALGKEKALEKFREHNLDYEWWDCVYEDAKEVGSLMGIEIGNIYFSGFGPKAMEPALKDHTNMRWGVLRLYGQPRRMMKYYGA